MIGILCFVSLDVDGVIVIDGVGVIHSRDADVDVDVVVAHLVEDCEGVVGVDVVVVHSVDEWLCGSGVVVAHLVDECVGVGGVDTVVGTVLSVTVVLSVHLCSCW